MHLKKSFTMRANTNGRVTWDDILYLSKLIDVQPNKNFFIAHAKEGVARHLCRVMVVAWTLASGCHPLAATMECVWLRTKGNAAARQGDRVSPPPCTRSAGTAIAAGLVVLAIAHRHSCTV